MNIAWSTTSAAIRRGRREERTSTHGVAGRISVTAGMVAGGVLMLLGPWLFYMSMRFKLANTSWRGLRFGFDSTAGQAYAVLAPAVVLGILFFGSLASVQRIAPGERPNFAPFLSRGPQPVLALGMGIVTLGAGRAVSGRPPAAQTCTPRSGRSASS